MDTSYYPGFDAVALFKFSYFELHGDQLLGSTACLQNCLHFRKMLSHLTTQHNVCAVHAVHQGMFSTLGDIMMSVEGYHKYSGDVQYTGGYHDKCGGIS